MMMPFIQTVKITSPTSDVNLSTLVGSRPASYMQIFVIIAAALTSTVATTASFDTGNGVNWYGSTICINSTASHTAATGTPGQNGLGGLGGLGGQGYQGGGGFQNGNGSNGGNGGNADNGSIGGTVFKIRTKVTIAASGTTLTRGAGGNGGIGGGGGGGGGGGATDAGWWGRNGGRGAGRDGAAAGTNELGGVFGAGTHFVSGVGSFAFQCGVGGNGGALASSGTSSSGGFDNYFAYSGTKNVGIEGVGGAAGANGSTGANGYSIDGYANITFIGATPTLIGATI